MPNDLFAAAAKRDQRGQPLAERMRPRGLDEVVGQDALLGPAGPLRRLLKRQAAFSCLLVGPPGSGKTTMGRLCAGELAAEFVPLSAVSAGIKDVREAAQRAGLLRDHQRRRTLLFVDEIHRFHRGQQDALLPYVESGLFSLVGATTENPRFSLTRALLSRARVFDLQPLTSKALTTLLQRALQDPERGLGKQQLSLSEAGMQELVALCGGDARRALGLLEACSHIAACEGTADITPAVIQKLLEQKVVAHDRAGEAHFDLASALIKSMRRSDERASAYYLARMLEGGESLEFILRRLVIFASEDVGLADAQAASVVSACSQNAERVGLPEAWYPLMHATLYLARAPKSRAVVRAKDTSREWVQEFGTLPVPAHLLNATSHEKARQGHEPGTPEPNSCLPVTLAEALQARGSLAPK